MSERANQGDPAARDLELMLRADGEGDALGETLSVGDLAKLEGLSELGEVVKTYLELEADAAEPRLEALWGKIEREITAQPGTAEAAAAAVPAPAPRQLASPGMWARLVDWFDEHRGYFLTGAVTAGAVAALILVLRPPRERIVERQVAVPARITEVAPVVMRSSAPEIETLEVMEGSGTVFTIPDEDGEGGTAVIWISSDETTVEGPI